MQNTNGSSQESVKEIVRATVEVPVDLYYEYKAVCRHDLDLTCSQAIRRHMRETVAKYAAA